MNGRTQENIDKLNPPFQTFEDYLQDVFMKEEPSILDDDLPDAFDAWISKLDGDDFLKHGDEYGRKMYDLVPEPKP